METRSVLSSKCRRNTLRKRKERSTPGGRSRNNEISKKSQKIKKIQDMFKLDDMEMAKSKVITMKKKIAYLQQIIMEKNQEISFLDKQLAEQRAMDFSSLEDQSVGNDDEEDSSEVAKCKNFIAERMNSEDLICKFTRLERTEFLALADQCRSAIEETTQRGSKRKRAASSKLLPTTDMIFITLFWLAQYPTLSFMSGLFFLHPRTITRIIKQSLIGMASILKQEIRWPSDEEFEAMKTNFAYFQNWNFSDLVCVVDGTEVRVSRPVDWEKQKPMWSGKKHQHSVNILFITALDGTILYHSGYHIGTNDQGQWNELELRNSFVGKSFGIAGDGGFYFNRKQDQVQIIGYKPHKVTHGVPLTDEQQKYNKHLSQMRVIVENTFARWKQWKILQSVFRHLRGSRHQLDLNHIITVVAALTNRSIKKHALRSSTWLAPEWREIFGDEQ